MNSSIFLTLPGITTEAISRQLLNDDVQISVTLYGMTTCLSLPRYEISPPFTMKNPLDVFSPYQIIYCLITVYRKANIPCIYTGDTRMFISSHILRSSAPAN